MKIYVDMDDTLFDFKRSYNDWKLRVPQHPYPQAQYGFFANLEPFPDALWAWNELKRFGEVYFLTAPSIMNPLCYTEKRVSVEKHFGLEACHNLIICEDKSLLRGDLLIDDRRDSNKQHEFVGDFIHFGTEQFPDWKYIIGWMDWRYNDGMIKWINENPEEWLRFNHGTSKENDDDTRCA